MLYSLALILLCGMGMGRLCKKLHLPPLLGMLAAGIILSPHMLNQIDGTILNISSDLRKIALVIILSRVGLALNLEDLKRVGRPAVLMCFVPACFEIFGMILLAPRFFGISVVEAAILGSVIGAVSPAVIVPKMLQLMEEGYGKKKSIPQLVLAGASVDDVFVIVLFTAFTSLAKGGRVHAAQFLKIPVSILLGVLIGLAAGYLLAVCFSYIPMRDTSKMLVFLAAALLLVAGEPRAEHVFPYSAYIAVMAAGTGLQKKQAEAAMGLSVKFNQAWVMAEILLFVLVGATVDLKYAAGAGGRAVILLGLVLLFRMCGVFLCLLGTTLERKERLFCMLAYTPKATVQAAIGGIPLAMGLACGNLVLTIAVLSIILTAPLGAFAIELTYQRLLKAE